MGRAGEPVGKKRDASQKGHVREHVTALLGTRSDVIYDTQR